MKQLFDTEDGERAVSPVIGVILMVAITVILAAVIASFVLGLGDSDEPAPNPTIETDFSSDELDVSITGGDDFDADVATVQADITVENSSDEDDFDEETLSGDITDGDLSENYDDLDNEPTVDYNPSIDGDEVTAGDSFSFNLDDDDFEIAEWEIEVIWDPADQDSEVIISQSS